MKSLLFANELGNNCLNNNGEKLRKTDDNKTRDVKLTTCRPVDNTLIDEMLDEMLNKLNNANK